MKEKHVCMSVNAAPDRERYLDNVAEMERLAEERCDDKTQLERDSPWLGACQILRRR